jgi:hypothetical protein
MITAKVNVVSGWGEEYARRVNAQVREAVREAAEAGAETASQIARARTRTGRMAQMEVLPVKGTPTGWEGGFRSRAWYAHFQSGGTPRIPPLRFLERGRDAARKALAERLSRL